MKIHDLLKESGNVQLVITGADLKEFFLEVLSEHDKQVCVCEEERYLSASETARKLHCTGTTLWRWNKSGYLCPVKVGAKRYYRASDVEQLMKGGE